MEMQRSKIRQNLRLMDRREGINCFQFYDKTPVYKQIKASLSNWMSLIHELEIMLTAEGNSPQC